MQVRELAQVLELMPDPVLIVDAEGAIRWLNRLAAAWLRADKTAGAASTLGTIGVGDWLSAGSIPELQRALARADHEWSAELELLSGRDTLWAHARGRGVDADEQRLWLLTLRACSVDRNERQQLNTELRRLRQAVDARRIGLYEHNHDTDEIFGSPTLREQYGIGPSEPLSISTFAAATHPHDSAFLLEEIAKAHDPAGDGDFNVVHRILIPSGETRWLHTRATTYFQTSEDGRRRPHYTVGACIDITREHENELAIRRLAAILDATPDVVATTHLDGRLTYLNASGRRLIGLAPDAALGPRHVSTLLPVERRSEFERVIVPSAIERGSWAGELQLCRLAGRPMLVSLVVLAHRQTRSMGAYLSLIAHDMSEQKELEAQLRHAQKLEAVGRLAGGIAHDFNNLLSVIFSFASLVRQNREVPERARAQTDEILRAGKRAAELTAQLLSFSRKQVLQPRVISVEHVLRSIQPMVQRLVGETIVVKLSLTDGDLRVKVDPSQLEQVLLNLIVNARDAMPNGGQLTLSAEQAWVGPTDVGPKLQLKPGAHVLIGVSDTGCGVPAELQTRVFEPFFTTKSAGEGTGLGLSTVFGIVTQSGGAIVLESEAGRGSTFGIYLPSTSEPLDEGVEPAKPHRMGSGAVILVVEDEAQLRGVLVTVLREAGYEPLAASGPLEALELVRRQSRAIDLVLTDVVMPGMSGKQLSEALQAAGSTIPVLYMSGYTGDTVLDHGGLQPSAGFLAKPFTPEQLLHKLAQALGVRKAEGE